MASERLRTQLATLPASVSRVLVGDLASIVGGRERAERLLEMATPRHLVTASLEELQRLLPKPKAERFHRILRFARAALTPERPTRLTDPQSVQNLLYGDLLGLEVERFWAIPVDAQLQPLAVTCVAQGSPSAVEVRPADVFLTAVRHRATALVCAHNHPSGALHPSEEDMNLTERLIEAGRLIGVELVDHVIVTPTSSASIREEFLMHARPWRTEPGGERSRAAVAQLAPYEPPQIRMTDRQRDQLLGHLQLLLDRVRELRDTEDRLPTTEKEVPELLSAVEDYDLLDDRTVLEAHSYLRGMAAGLGLPDLADLAAYARNRLTALPDPPNWASLIKATGHAAELLSKSIDPTAMEAERVLTTALGNWRNAPWR